MALRALLAVTGRPRLDGDTRGLWVVSQALPGIVLRASAARNWHGPAHLDAAAGVVGFGVRAWVGGLSHFLNARTDQILTALLAGEATLGIYAVAVNASEVLFYLPSGGRRRLLPPSLATRVATASGRCVSFARSRC